MSRSLQTQTASKLARVVSKTHLKTGDALPVLRAGRPWLFSAQLSPFAQRVRLVLETKGISYDVINCHLKSKPECLVKRNPRGKVPVLEIDGKVTTESLVICELIEDLYPEPPLRPKDPFDKARDRAIVELYTQKVQNPMLKIFFEESQKAKGQLLDGLAFIERELVGRGAPFFGGQGPGMADLMIWPFNERLTSVDQFNKLVQAQFLSLAGYFRRMECTPAAKATASPQKAHLRFLTEAAQSNQRDRDKSSSKL